MKQLQNIEIRYKEEEGSSYNITNKIFGMGSDMSIDEFFDFLVVEGFYHDITVTKKFNLTDEVIKRMKGKK